MSDLGAFGPEEHVEDVDAAAGEPRERPRGATKQRTRGAQQVLLLHVVDAGEAAGERAVTAMPDLDHHKHVTPANDHVELVSPEAQVLPEDLVPLNAQERDCGFFRSASFRECRAFGGEPGVPSRRARAYCTHLRGSFTSSELAQLLLLLKVVPDLTQ